MSEINLSEKTASRLRQIEDITTVRKEFSNRISVIDQVLMLLADRGTGEVQLVISPVPNGIVNIPAVIVKKLLHNLQNEYLVKINETTKDLENILS